MELPLKSGDDGKGCFPGANEQSWKPRRASSNPGSCRREDVILLPHFILIDHCFNS